MMGYVVSVVDFLSCLCSGRDKGCVYLGGRQ
jgi:hypothetical protein